MREAVIVSTARTPIGRAYRGAFNDTQAQALAGHVVAEAVRRAGIDPAEIEDVVLGAAIAAGLDRLQHRAPGGDPRRPAGHGRRHVDRPAMRLGADGDRDRGQGDRP